MNKITAFYAAGYYITNFVDRPAMLSSELLPPRILTIASCFARHLPDGWALSWVGVEEKERADCAASFGVTPDRAQELVRWATDQFQVKFGWPNVCYSLEVAREIYQTFLPQPSSSVILGLALHESHAELFLRESSPPPQEPGFAPMGISGTHAMISKRIPCASGGSALGFEPLCTNIEVEHSWLCNGLETTVFEELQIRPNKHGFIDEFNDAKRCADYIGQPEIGAEPGLWLPWLVMQYEP